VYKNSNRLYRIDEHSILTPELVKSVISKYSMNLRGVHGAAHWMRVRKNGMILVEETGADRAVVELFALFHDSQRKNDGWDEGHGERGAKFALKLRKKKLFELSDSAFDKLYEACCGHTMGGYNPEDITIATCWDADRLDLERVGITPNPEKLCTKAACNPELILWSKMQVNRWESNMRLDWNENNKGVNNKGGTTKGSGLYFCVLLILVL
jgi:uncharacterized protein